MGYRNTTLHYTGTVHKETVTSLRAAQVSVVLIPTLLIPSLTGRLVLLIFWVTPDLVAAAAPSLLWIVGVASL